MTSKKVVVGYFEKGIWKATLYLDEGWQVTFSGANITEQHQQYKEILEYRLNTEFPPHGKPSGVRGFSAAAGCQWSWAIHHGARAFDAEPIVLYQPKPQPYDPKLRY